jgi:UDP-N-acetylglucosamine 2-epimerase (non-hydrolysing)
VKVLSVVGNRPQFIKSGPVSAALLEAGIDEVGLHTGQHWDPELSDVFYEELGLPEPDYRLDLHTADAETMRPRIAEVLAQERPDWTLVYGDTNSTRAGARAAGDVPVAHVEAGLRSFDPTMPEELNRRLTDQVATLLLTHSESAHANLAAEGIPGERVRFVGNTMIDTLLASLDAARAVEARRTHGLEEGGYLLVTLHRPALVDRPELLARTMAALASVARELPVVFPVHPRTHRNLEAAGLAVPPGVELTPPLPYLTFLSLEAAAGAVLTDSGGVQEETTALGVPCFTLRANTERPVTVTDGTNVLLGLDPGAIETIPARLGEPRPARQPPLWDGRAGERAADAIEEALGVAAPVDEKSHNRHELDDAARALQG